MTVTAMTLLEKVGRRKRFKTPRKKKVEGVLSTTDSTEGGGCVAAVRMPCRVAFFAVCLLETSATCSVIAPFMQRLFAVVNSVRSLGRRTFSSGRAHSKAARAGVAVAAVGGVALVAYSQVPDGYNCYSIPDGKKGAFLFEWYKNAVTVTLEGSGAVYRGAVKDGIVRANLAEVAS